MIWSWSVCLLWVTIGGFFFWLWNPATVACIRKQIHIHGRQVTALSSVSLRTTYFTSRDSTCVWALVMNVSLWPRATHPTDSSTGPSSDASLCLHWDALKWVHDAERCSFVFSVLSRARTMTFNLFLYIEDWAAAGKFSIPLGTAQCATAEGGIEVMLRLRPWTEIPGTVKTISAGNVCTVFKSSQNVCKHWTSYQSN